MPDDKIDWWGMFYGATPVFPAHVVLNRDIDDGMIALRILLHEMCHYATESECAIHGKKFNTVARAVGLYRKANELAPWVTPTPTLHQTLERILRKLGSYPQ